MDIRAVRNADEAIAFTTDEVMRAVSIAWDAGRAAHVVLTGGRSGAALGAAIASGLYGESRGDLHLWIADERFVDYDDIDRNDTPLLLALGPMAERCTFHRHDTPAQGTAETSALNYAEDLDAWLGHEPFDAVVVSMGEDGHVASVFPGPRQPELIAYAELNAPKPPAKRTTMALARLSNTRRCVILALGEDKLGAVQAFIRGDGIPARQLAELTPTTVLSDADLTAEGA